MPTTHEIIIDIKKRYQDMTGGKLDRDIRDMREVQAQQTYEQAGRKPSRKEMTETAERKRQIAFANEESRARKAQRQQVLFSGLSIMFFGMAVSRAMMGILQPAAEVAGIFDIINLILTLLFLPVMLAILPYLIDLLGWVAGLGEETKLAVGWIAVFVAAIAIVVQWLAMMVLGWGGISTVIEALGGIVGVVTAGLGVLASTILAGLAIVAGVFLALKFLEGVLLEVAKAAGEFLASLIPDFIKEGIQSASDKGLFMLPEAMAGVTKGVGETVGGLGGVGEVLGGVWDWTFGPVFGAGQTFGQAVTVNVLNSPGVQTDEVTQTTPSGTSEVSVNTSG